MVRRPFALIFGIALVGAACSQPPTGTAWDVDSSASVPQPSTESTPDPEVGSGTDVSVGVSECDAWHDFQFAVAYQQPATYTFERAAIWLEQAEANGSSVGLHGVAQRVLDELAAVGGDPALLSIDAYWDYVEVTEGVVGSTEGDQVEPLIRALTLCPPTGNIGATDVVDTLDRCVDRLNTVIPSATPGPDYLESFGEWAAAEQAWPDCSFIRWAGLVLDDTQIASVYAAADGVGVSTYLLPLRTISDQIGEFQASEGQTCATYARYVDALLGAAAPAELFAATSAWHDAIAADGGAPLGVEAAFRGAVDAFAAAGNPAVVSELGEYRALADGILGSSIEYDTIFPAWVSSMSVCDHLVDIEEDLAAANVVRCVAALDPVLASFIPVLEAGNEPEPVALIARQHEFGTPVECNAVGVVAEIHLDAARFDAAIAEAVAGFSADGLHALELLGQTAETTFVEVDQAIA